MDNIMWLVTEFERTAPRGDIQLVTARVPVGNGAVFAWSVITPLMTLEGETEALTLAFRQAEFSADLPLSAPGAWVGRVWEQREDDLTRRVRRVGGKFYGSVHRQNEAACVGPVIVTAKLEDAMLATMGLGEERAS